MTIPRSDVAVPFTISSPDLCNAGGLVDAILDPTGRVGPPLRANFASAVGLNPKVTFIHAVWACDGSYFPVARDAAINKLDVSSLVSKGGNGERRLRLDGVESGASVVLSRRLSAMTDRLNITLDGQTFVVELGVSVPTAIATQISAFLSATLGGGSASEIALAASALDLAISRLVTSAPEEAPSSTLLDTLTTIINSNGQSGADAFVAPLSNVTTSVLEPLVTALGLPTSAIAGIQQGIFADGIRSMETETVSPTEESSGLSQGGAAGIVVAVILAVMIAAYAYIRYRKAQQAEAEKAAAKAPTTGSVTTIQFAQVNPMAAAPNTAAQRAAFTAVPLKA